MFEWSLTTRLSSRIPTLTRCKEKIRREKREDPNHPTFACRVRVSASLALAWLSLLTLLPLPPPSQVNNLQDEFIGRLTELREMKRLGPPPPGPS